MLEQQLDRLSPMGRSLRVGAWPGPRLSAAAGSGTGLGHEVVQVEEWCSDLARRRQWLQADGEQSWPDGTAMRLPVYACALPGGRHPVDGSTAGAAASPHRRAQGGRLWGAQARQMAAEWRCISPGRDAWRAVHYLHYAGENALRRNAYQEAITHLTTGLEVLATLPETPRRAQQELDLQVVLGPAFMVTRGPASPAVEQVYARAQELCQQVGETPQLFPVLWGLWRQYNNRCSTSGAALGEQLLSLAQQVRCGAPPGGPQRVVPPCSLPESLPLPEPTWSRGGPSTIPSSTTHMPCSMAATIPVCAVYPLGPVSCGCLAILTRPCLKHS